MKITRSQLRKLIFEAVAQGMYDNEVSDVVNAALTKLGLRKEYRAFAMIADKNTPAAVLIPGAAEGPALPVKFDAETASDLIESIEGNQMTSAVFGTHDVDSGTITFQKMQGG